MSIRLWGYALLAVSIVLFLLMLSTLDPSTATEMSQGLFARALSSGQTLTFLTGGRYGGVPFGIAVTLDAALALVGVGMIAFKRE